MTNNLSDSVFVYRHRDTGEIRALYIDDARAMAGRNDYEHVASLEPRAWIEHHFEDAIKEREACAQVAEEWLGPTKNREMAIAAAIRARGTK